MRRTDKQWYTITVVLLYLLVFGVATLVINVMAYQVEPTCGEREP